MSRAGFFLWGNFGICCNKLRDSRVLDAETKTILWDLNGQTLDLVESREQDHEG
jgi:hypothetical protein